MKRLYFIFAIFFIALPDALLAAQSVCDELNGGGAEGLDCYAQKGSTYVACWPSGSSMGGFCDADGGTLDDFHSPGGAKMRSCGDKCYCATACPANCTTNNNCAPGSSVSAICSSLSACTCECYCPSTGSDSTGSFNYVS
ncbi:MAG: hypothetical protein LBJ18_01870 [Rickettsiales bacterium]|nr:hypothetical protein [Rickettsiales bacterium]